MTPKDFRTVEDIAEKLEKHTADLRLCLGAQSPIVSLFATEMLGLKHWVNSKSRELDRLIEEYDEKEDDKRELDRVGGE